MEPMAILSEEGSIIFPLKEGSINFKVVELKFTECVKRIDLKYSKAESSKLHSYGNKTFCKFSIDREFAKKKGIYCFAINGKIIYIGRCTDNFCKRINAGYGNISPRNCYEGGQTTNCRINSLIEENKNNKIQFGIYDMTNKSKDDICNLEKQLLSYKDETKLEWNIQGK